MKVCSSNMLIVASEKPNLSLLDTWRWKDTCLRGWSHRPLLTPSVRSSGCNSVKSHLFLNIVLTNFTVGTGWKAWCDRGMRALAGKSTKHEPKGHSPHKTLPIYFHILIRTHKVGILPYIMYGRVLCILPQDWAIVLHRRTDLKKGESLQV